MSEFTEFDLPSGAVLQVQSRLYPPVPPGVPGREATRQASGAEEAREAWVDGLDLVREVAEGVVDRLSAAAKGADEIRVEFGVSLKGRSGIILVEGEAAANLKVTIAWKPGAA